MHAFFIVEKKKVKYRDEFFHLYANNIGIASIYRRG